MVVRGFNPDAMPVPTVVPLPTSTAGPVPTATPEPCALVPWWHMSDSFSAFCYEVLNTGIGQKCIVFSTMQYGAFPPGTYTWCAEWWPWWNYSSEPYKETCEETVFGSGHTLHEFWSDFDKYPPTPFSPY